MVAMHTVSADIVTARREGWEYLWGWRADAQGAAAKMLIAHPTAAYMKRVYEEGCHGAG
ncbi:hypothetical protein LCGC14_1488310 [marine sediment metagenome]|uniref:Uncharacterized protein n=1 Tax=marine sediment metagenome TaxID=412755 RepID=A0A0F9M9B2_9ZZZZ